MVTKETYEEILTKIIKWREGGSKPNLKPYDTDWMFAFCFNMVQSLYQHNRKEFNDICNKLNITR